MNNTHIKQVKAITSVYPEGQKCIGIIIEYDLILKHDSVCLTSFAVQERSVLEIKVLEEENQQDAKDGRFIKLSLSPNDEKSKTYFPGEPWENIGARVVPASVTIIQKQPILSKTGEEIYVTDAFKNDQVRNLLVEEFVQGSFEGLAYNLFIPRNYDPDKKYPLVQFIHDAAVCSTDVDATLAQGVGALVWMTKQAQEKQECFVLAPQFAPPTIVDDDWNVDHRLEVEKRLLDQIVNQYNIDKSRLYTTGQSMGCMSSMVLNIRYPDLFAASLFVAGQWDEKAFAGKGLEHKHFWFINSQGDAKAFPGMNQILVELEKEGAAIAREVWKTGEAQEVYGEKTKALLDTKATMIYTPFEMTSIADGWHSNGGEHHINTWRHAYSIDAIHEWLFAQHQ